MKANDSIRKPNGPAGLNFLLWVFLFLITTGVQAQLSQTIYFMDRIPQSSLVNPAYQHNHNFHLLLPGVSSFNVNAGTNFVRYKNVIFNHPAHESPITFLHPDANPMDFTADLRGRNIVTTDLHANILSTGFRAGRSFIGFNISERFSGRTSMPQDLLKIAIEGGHQYIGRTINLSNVQMDFHHFREYAASWSYRANEALDLGIRAKMLFGKFNLSAVSNDLSLTPEEGIIKLRTDLILNMSLPINVLRDSEGDITGIDLLWNNDGYDPLGFVFNRKNPGFAADLGATYRIMEKIKLYASITDMGFINWKHDVYNFSLDGDMEIEWTDLSTLFDSGLGDGLIDTMNSRFTLNEASRAYRDWLPGKMYIGGTYDLTSSLNLGILGRSIMYRGNIRQALTVSANANAGRLLSASMSYSVMNNSYNNLGLGVALRGGGFQLYILSDNLNMAFYRGGSSNANVWFGLNIVIGHVRPAQSLPG
jgi:hypothetical protein